MFSSAVNVVSSTYVRMGLLNRRRPTMTDLRLKVAEERGWAEIEWDEQSQRWIGRIPDNIANDENRGCKAWIPEYDTSMDACMELVEEALNVPRCCIEINISSLGSEVRVMQRQAHTSGYTTIARGCGVELPEAICNWYLKWKEGE
jgi:hypothetical protein